MKRSILVAVCAALSSSAFCEDREVRYFIGGTNSKSVLLDASFWKDADGNKGTEGASLDAETDYVNVSGDSVFTPNVTSGESGCFNVHSLTLGAVNGTKGGLQVYTMLNAEMTFGEGGLICNKGTIMAQGTENRSVTFAGPVTIGANSSSPYEFSAYYKFFRFIFKDRFIGGSGAVSRFSPHSNGYAENSMAVEIRDASEYYGTIRIGNTLAGYVTTTTLLPGSDFPGSVLLNKTGRIEPLYGTNTVAVGSLEMKAGSTLAVGSRIWQDEEGCFCGTSGSFRVTGDFTYESPVRIAFDENAVVPDGKTCRVPVLTVPSASTLVKEDFMLVSAKNDCVQIGEFEVVEDAVAGTKTLVAVFEPVVMLVKSDPTSINYVNSSALTNPACWSDGLLPHERAHYLVRAIPGNTTNGYGFSTMVHSLSGTESSHKWSNAYNQVFPGKSLTFARSCMFLLAAKKFTCGKFRFLDGAGVCSSQWICEASPVLEGGIEIPEGATASFGATGAWTVKAPVTGGGEILLAGPLSATSSRTGNLRFEDLTGFYGRIQVKESAKLAPGYDKNYQTFRVGAPKEYGGAMTALDHQGVVLESYSRLRTAASVTVPASCNRGLYVGGTYGGIVYTDHTDGVPHVLDLGVPLTLNGSMVKDGPGVLTLRGEACFGTDAYGTPTEGKNVIEVRAGSLGVASAGCLDGVAVSFTNDTELVLNIHTNDAEFLEYGLRNVKTGVPFSLKGDLTELPLAFDVSALPKDAVRELNGLRIGLFTVKSDFADTLRAMLPDAVNPYPTCVARLTEVPREDTGSVTFALDVVPNGLKVIIR